MVGRMRLVRLVWVCCQGSGKVLPERASSALEAIPAGLRQERASL